MILKKQEEEVGLHLHLNQLLNISNSTAQLQRSHKFAGTFNGVPLPETLPLVPEVPPRLDMDGQYHAYINLQGCLRSHRLHMLQHRLILWGCGGFLSLRAPHGGLNAGGGPALQGHAGVWRVDSAMEQIWARYG